MPPSHASGLKEYGLNSCITRHGNGYVQETWKRINHKFNGKDNKWQGKAWEIRKDNTFAMSTTEDLMVVASKISSPDNTGHPESLYVAMKPADGEVLWIYNADPRDADIPKDSKADDGTNLWLDSASNSNYYTTAPQFTADGKTVFLTTRDTRNPRAPHPMHCIHRVDTASGKRTKIKCFEVSGVINAIRLLLSRDDKSLVVYAPVGTFTILDVVTLEPLIPADSPHATWPTGATTSGWVDMKGKLSSPAQKQITPVSTACKVALSIQLSQIACMARVGWR